MRPQTFFDHFLPLVAKSPLFSLNSFIIAKKNHKNKRNRVGKVGFWPQFYDFLLFSVDFLSFLGFTAMVKISQKKKNHAKTFQLKTKPRTLQTNFKVRPTVPKNTHAPVKTKPIRPKTKRKVIILYAPPLF